MSLKQIQIEKSVNSIRVRNVNPDKENVWEYYPVANIKSITTHYELDVRAELEDGSRKSTYPFDDKFQVQINFVNEHDAPSIVFDVQSISNQPTWTANLAGLFQAVADINAWI